MRHCRSQSKRTRGKPWWLKHYWLLFAAITSAVFHTVFHAVFNGSGSAPIAIAVFIESSSGSAPTSKLSPEDLAHQQEEVGILRQQLRICKEQAAKREHEWQDEKRVERERRSAQEKQDRERKREEAERVTREQREREELRREVIALSRMEAQKQKGQTAQPIPAVTEKENQQYPAPFDAAKLARAIKAEVEEEKAAQKLEKANEMLIRDQGSVRRAREAWAVITEQFPKTRAARQASKSLADTRELLNAENEKAATEALKAARCAFDNGGYPLARLRCRSILEEYPGTTAAKEAKEMYELSR